MIRVFLVFCFLLSPLWARGADPVEILKPLLDPVRLDALQGDRSANRRLRLMMYWIETGRVVGTDPEVLILAAQRKAGYAGTPRADADRESLVRNRMILERLGCLDAAGMVALKKGKAPSITKGPYAGDIVEVDHIIPFKVAPELDSKLYNLEFMPSRMNRAKAGSVGVRQKQLAAKWRKTGLLSEQGFQAVTGSARFR